MRRLSTTARRSLLRPRRLSTAFQEVESSSSSNVGLYPGAPASEYTEALHYFRPLVDTLPPIMPTFRLIDDDGDAVPGAVLPSISAETCVEMQETMVRVNEFDKVFNDAQRQGRLSFYFTNRGEEAQAVGSAAALENHDWVWPQYRELGAIMWRGYTFEEMANQCCHNELDATKGRQLPMHIGSPTKNVQYVKSNLGQQVPAANGAAFAMKLRAAAGGEAGCAITYFGEGCASEGDIPSALNIAAVHDCPTIFFCRNNGYAISTAADEQYRGDGVAPRGVAYGMDSIRVDGNDILAVYAATREARRLAVEESRPTMIEAMSYRVNSHSTSDDDSKYRRTEAPDGSDVGEIGYWEARSPIIRFGRYLERKGWWSATREEELRAESRKHAIKALNDAEQLKQPHIKHLFTDVFDELPPHLQEQQTVLKEHLSKYRDHYTSTHGVSEEEIDSL